ncbi:MAG: hypothetical protein ACXW20_22185, partial [Burkholderiales bacterium]
MPSRKHRGRSSSIPEVIDPIRFAGIDLEPALQALFTKKYEGQKLDVILASGRPALQFAERHRDRVWPGVPVVLYNVIEEALDGRKRPSGVTGVTIRFDPRANLELAARLQPSARNLVVISGTGEYDKRWVDRVAPLLRDYEQRFKTDLFICPTIRQLRDDVAKLPIDTIVLHLSVVRDGSRNVLPRDAIKEVAAASTAPSYSFFETGNARSAPAHGSTGPHSAWFPLNIQ